ncbi:MULTISPECIES: SPFH domain-containing protein [unclassified Streptomyces]|uniref:SPFH domain-containing protein n=1 Tax=unclassified Streptomyces TaxID=2593676 RepID=UPI00069A26F2|nr:SPFH domain-containing protein [Streptomyces sp. CNQ-509]
MVVLVIVLLVAVGAVGGVAVVYPESGLARRLGFVVIPGDMVGVVRRRIGGNPSDPRFKRVVADNSRGIQARCLTPGVRHWLMPGVYSVDLAPRVSIPPGMIGLVTALDGASRPAGRLLSRRVECDNFQNGVAFLLGEGEQGRQLATLPGDASYYINPELFRVDFVPRTHVPDGTVGLVRAKVGQLRLPDQPFGRYVECDVFQDGDAFLLGGGEQGRQLAVLGGGASYDIHPDLFEVLTTENIGPGRQDGLTPGHLRYVNIPVGYVGVVVTLHGIEPPPEDDVIGPVVPGHSNYRLPWKFLDGHGWRGVQQETLRQGGVYALNPWFARIVLIPTRLLTLEWKDKMPTEADNYDAELEQLIINIQGFLLKVNVTQTLQIPASAAPRLVSQFGGEVSRDGLGGLVIDPRPVQRFVERVLGGTVESYLTQVAASSTVEEYLTQQDDIRAELAARVRQNVAEWGITVSDTLVGLSVAQDSELDRIRRLPMTEAHRRRTLEEEVKSAQIHAQIRRIEIAVEREERGLAVAELEALANLLGPEVASVQALLAEVKDMRVPDVISGDAAMMGQFMPWQRIQDVITGLRREQSGDPVLETVSQKDELEAGDGPADDLRPGS